MGKKQGKLIKSFLYLLLVAGLIFALVDDLDLINLLKGEALEDFSQAYFLDQGLIDPETKVDLIHQEDLDYSRLLIFKADKSYLATYFIKGRLTNFYNFKADYNFYNMKENMEEETLLNFKVLDSVYEYSFDISILGDKVSSLPIYREFHMDFSGLALIAIFLLVASFLYFKKGELVQLKSKL